MGKSNYSDLSSNEMIRQAIREIALRGLVSPRTNAVNGAGRIAGYVVKINTAGDLAGTIDVQEYVQGVNNKKGVKVGYHEGVYLSAIQDNSKGVVMIPKLYSDVVIAEDVESGREYVTMYSHVDIIQLDSHDTISVGVREREPFDDKDENAPDVDELAETGQFSNTTFKKGSVQTVVQSKKDKETSVVRQTIDSTQISQVVGDNKSSSVINGTEIGLKHGKAEAALTDNAASMTMGSSSVKVNDGTVYVGSDKNTDDAVLGIELASILSEILGCLGKLMTPTQMGPQPPTNVASFISLKAKIESFKSSHSGFLTKKVQIQK